MNNVIRYAVVSPRTSQSTSNMNLLAFGNRRIAIAASQILEEIMSHKRLYLRLINYDQYSIDSQTPRSLLGPEFGDYCDDYYELASFPSIAVVLRASLLVIDPTTTIHRA